MHELEELPSRPFDGSSGAAVPSSLRRAPQLNQKKQARLYQPLRKTVGKLERCDLHHITRGRPGS